jgi:two-component system, cell cycle sensor histidine kinase and response regulator CckA
MITSAEGEKPLSRLLVVDDDNDNALVLKLNLVNNGFLVDAFTNPEDALNSFKSNPESYSLVLSDNWMSSLSGMQLAEKVKKANPNVKVLLLSGSEMIENESSKVSPSTSVVDGFVQKPIGIRELTNKILSLIGEAKGQTPFEG